MIFNDHDRELAAKLFGHVRSASTVDAQLGITRQSYGPGETNALNVLAYYAEELRIGTDAAGNRTFRLPYDNRTTNEIWIGSHADSVPSGGNFDGLAGIVAGLLVLKKLCEGGIAPPRPIHVVGFRGEESAWFGIPYIGAKALLGQLNTLDLPRKLRGSEDTLWECMRACGARTDQIFHGEILLDVDDIAEFWELHIEQGPVLVEAAEPLGIVTAIRGNIRMHGIEIHGEAGHSGTTPRRLRKDAVLAFAAFVQRINETWSVLEAMGHDLVVTCGIVETDARHHAITRIPDSVRFSLEWRSDSSETLLAFRGLLDSLAKGIAKHHDVTFKMPPAIETPPAHLSEELVVVALAASKNAATKLLPSGAGHDAALFANVGVKTGMIFVRNANGSHNPNEAMTIDDFMQATELLYAVTTRQI